MAAHGFLGAAAVALSFVIPAAAAASGWTVQATPNPAGAGSASLASVSCPSPRVCIAVGDSRPRRGPGAMLAERWDGDSWSIQRTPTASGGRSTTFASVSCPSSDLCVAVGSFETRTGRATTLAARWNGRGWTVQRTPNPAHASAAYLRGVSCPSQRFCVAVGYFRVIGHSGGLLAERWNGRRWAIQRVPPSAFGSTLAGVSCPMWGSCFAVGGVTPAYGPAMPLALRWNGKRWIRQPFSAAASHSLLGVSCPERSACTAVGRPATLGEHWTGTTWRIQRLPTPPRAQDSQLSSDSCVASRTCIAVGSFFTLRTVPLAERWNGGRWRIQHVAQPAGRKPAGLEGVSCPSHGVCIAVGWWRVSPGADRTLAERYRP